ncbi:MAG: hypothetical protein LBJ45_00360 [Holosporaceae bacterium]|nr:hypothetical protein [Holosporaceae bacterium]
MVGKNMNEVNKSVEKSDSACGICGKRSCLLGAAVALILLLVVAYYLHGSCCKKSVSGVSCVDVNNGECSGKIALLQAEISRLKSEMQELMLRTDQKLGLGRDGIREKWKAWVALRFLIESGEPLEEELERFRKLFADDEETLKLVEELILDLNPAANDNGALAICKKYLKKVIKFKKTDCGKLMKISGYVLSSPGYSEEKKK